MVHVLGLIGDRMMMTGERGEWSRIRGSWEGDLRERRRWCEIWEGFWKAEKTLVTSWRSSQEIFEYLCQGAGTGVGGLVMK